jgi:hypothetical protein
LHLARQEAKDLRVLEVAEQNDEVDDGDNKQEN